MRRDDRLLSDLSWTVVRRSATVLVPLGSTEQHGPHLPLNTDTTIATAVAYAAAGLLSHRQSGAFVVAPPINYGASGEHQDFRGTISVGRHALRLQLIEMVRSVSTWAERIVIVNAHGGNVASLVGSVSQLIIEGHNVGWASCSIDGRDAHAGHVETSLMLHLAPELVQMTRAHKGNTAPLDQLHPQIVDRGVAHVSPSGVLGDPTSASAKEGVRILAAMVENMAARIEGNGAGEDGCLQRAKGPLYKPSA